MKIVRTIFVFVILIILTCSLVGCGSRSRVKEEEIYVQSINAFFDALDKGDANAIRSLFSQTVISNDSDLNEQIDKLISIYPRATTTIKFDGLLGGEYKTEESKFKSVAYKTFPVISNNEYYWVYIELIYEDDFNSDNIGLNRVCLYTADEYCMFFHGGNAKYPSDIGLFVYAEQRLEAEIRCIEYFPYEFTPIERNLKLSEVKVFLKSNTDFAEFTSVFGQANAKSSPEAYYYEIRQADGKTVYLEVGVQDEKIIYSNLVDEFDHIECILEEQSD